jgi:hypothetical protein
MRRRLNRIALIALVASLAVSAAAGSASATRLEIGGVPKTEKMALTASLESGLKVHFSNTYGDPVGPYSNWCAGSHLSATATSLEGATKAAGAINTLLFSSCEFPVTAHQPGQLYIEHIAGTTNGLVRTANTELTITLPAGTLTCKTGPGSSIIGILTGKASGHATLDINAVLNCGFVIPTFLWRGSYTVVSPTGLGVTE